MNKGWFSEKNLIKPPPLWKQILLLIGALFPPLMLESIYLLPHMTALNPVVAKFICVAITVGITSTILLPISAYLMHWWLQPNSKIKEILGVFIIFIFYLLELTLFTIIN